MKWLLVKVAMRQGGSPFCSLMRNIIADSFVLCADVVGWRAVMEKVDKGCSEFCITVGTATRTVGVLMLSRLNALAVNLNHPSGHLWLYAGLIGFDHPCWLKADLVACANPSSSSWV